MNNARVKEIKLEMKEIRKEMKNRMIEMRVKMKEIREEMKNLRIEMRDMRLEMKMLKEEVKENLKVLKEDLKVLKEDLKVLKEDLKVLKEEVKESKVMENRIENKIESRIEIEDKSNNGEGVDWYKEEEYSGKKVIAFSKGCYKWNGVRLKFNNMGRCPIRLGDIEFQSVEAGYIATNFDGRKMESVEIQHKLAALTNGMMAKRKYRFKKEYSDIERKDFKSGAKWRLELMLWLNWQKCLVDKDFRERLCSIPSDYVIVENQNGFTHASARWGCKNEVAKNERNMIRKKLLEANLDKSKSDKLSKSKIWNIAELESWDKGVWKGRNYQGKILMECRRALLTNTQPRIDIEALNNAQIYIDGKLLKF
jgi:predicted NAD-dependent protein-ADP-ribosyltransferase YbiA (DUF1768 family)